jgi:hypothetical protein
MLSDKISTFARRVAYDRTIGTYSATLGGGYTSSLTVYLTSSGDCRIAINSRAPIGGMDGPGGITRDPEQTRFVDGYGKALIHALKDIIRGDTILSRGKAKDFRWHFAYRGMVETGLSIKKAQMCLDSHNMDRDVWEAKYLKPKTPRTRLRKITYTGRSTVGMRDDLMESFRSVPGMTVEVGRSVKNSPALLVTPEKKMSLKKIQALLKRMGVYVDTSEMYPVYYAGQLPLGVTHERDSWHIWVNEY